MKSVDFEELLDQCLLRLSAGESLEAILAEHPLEANELRQLLPLAGAYQSTRPPLPSLAGRSHGKQAMLAAFDEAFPARPVGWWERLWSGPSRPLIYAGGALAAVVMMLVAVFALRPPGVTVAETAPTEAAAVALVPTEADEATAAEIAEIPTEMNSAASPAALPTMTTVAQESRNGDSAFAAANEAEEDGIAATPGLAGSPIAAVPPLSGDSTGASAALPFEGEWLLTGLNGNVLTEPLILIMNVDGTFIIVTECGDLAGQFAASSNMLTFWAVTGTPAGCAPEAEQLVDELKLALEAVAYWDGELTAIISLQDDDGHLLLEMKRPVE